MVSNYAKLFINACITGVFLKKTANEKYDFVSRKNSIESNLAVWDEAYQWPEDGDEWSGQARYCNQNYEDWKSSIVDTFINPYLSRDSSVLEIAPGHGRWTQDIIGNCGQLTLIDLSPSCIAHCRKLFSDHDNIAYLVNDGKSLEGVEDESVDFIWSFDSFVHMSRSVIDDYFREIHRVLKEGGVAIIHHAGRNDFSTRLNFLRSAGKTGRRIYKFISIKRLRGDDGWRSDISRQAVAGLAMKNGLTVDSQVRSWGSQNQYSVEKYRDYISILRKDKPR